MNPDTLLFRMVHLSCVQGNTITSQVFQPAPMGTGVLSVYYGGSWSPEDAWNRFTGLLQGTHQFVGVVGVTVAECQVLELPVTLVPDALSEHAVIDFSGLSRNQIRRKSISLREFAVARGWLFRP